MAESSTSTDSSLSGTEGSSGSTTGEPDDDPVGASGAFRGTLPDSFIVFDSAADPDGGVVLVGNIQRPSGNGVNREAAIARIDDSGQVEWARWTNWASNDQFFGALVMNSRVFGVGLTRNGANPGDQILVSEFGLDGIYVGSTVFGTNGNEHGWSATETSGGGMAIVGFSTAPGFGGEDGLLLKLDSALEQEFAIGIGGANADRFHGVAQDEGGGYVMSGYLGTGADPQAWIAVVDAAGTFRLSAAFGGGPADRALAAAPMGRGRYLFAGDTAAWGAGGTDGFLGVLSVGNPPTVEAWTLGGAGYDSLTELVDLGEQQFVVAGMTESGDTADAWLMQVDASETPTLEWQHAYPLPRQQFVRGSSACQRADGGLAVAFHDGEDGGDTLFEPGVLYTNSAGLIEDRCPPENVDPFELTPIDDVPVATEVSTASVSFVRTVLTPADQDFDELSLTPLVDACR